MLGCYYVTSICLSLSHPSSQLFIEHDHINMNIYFLILLKIHHKRNNILQRVVHNCCSPISIDHKGQETLTFSKCSNQTSGRRNRIFWMHEILKSVQTDPCNNVYEYACWPGLHWCLHFTDQ